MHDDQEEHLAAHYISVSNHHDWYGCLQPHRQMSHLHSERWTKQRPTSYGSHPTLTLQPPPNLYHKGGVFTRNVFQQSLTKCFGKLSRVQISSPSDAQTFPQKYSLVSELWTFWLLDDPLYFVSRPTSEKSFPHRVTVTNNTGCILLQLTITSVQQHYCLHMHLLDFHHYCLEARILNPLSQTLSYFPI